MTDIEMAHIGNFMMPRAVLDAAVQYKKDHFWPWPLVTLAAYLYPGKVTVSADNELLSPPLSASEILGRPVPKPPSRFVVLGPTHDDAKWTVIGPDHQPVAWFLDPHQAQLFAEALNNVGPRTPTL